MWKCAYVYSVVEGERQEKKKRRKRLDRLPIPSFVVILFLFEIGKYK